jgi:hypothetical protein
MVDRALVNDAFALGLKQVGDIVYRLGANCTEVGIIETCTTLGRAFTDTRLTGWGFHIQCGNCIRINSVVSGEVHFQRTRSKAFILEVKLVRGACDN